MENAKFVEPSMGILDNSVNSITEYSLLNTIEKNKYNSIKCFIYIIFAADSSPITIIIMY